MAASHRSAASVARHRLRATAASPHGRTYHTYHSRTVYTPPSPFWHGRASALPPLHRPLSSLAALSSRPSPASPSSALFTSPDALPSSPSRAAWSLLPRPVSPSSLGSFTSPSAFSQRNICLMGSPGSGKSSVGRELSSLLSLPLLDVDEDLLEATWKVPVAEKLTQLGEETFLQEEGRLLSGLNVQRHIISLSGSVRRAAQRHSGGWPLQGLTERCCLCCASAAAPQLQPAAPARDGAHRAHLCHPLPRLPCGPRALHYNRTAALFPPRPHLRSPSWAAELRSSF